MRLTGDALEWYSHNVEHYARATHHWTLESALVGLQERFLHLLTYRHMLMQFNAAQQGSGTARDLLDRLTRFASRMVEYPSGYTMLSRFTAALNEPLRCEVFLQGLTPEFSSLADLLSAAERIENACNTSLHGIWRNQAAILPLLQVPSPQRNGINDSINHNSMSCSSKQRWTHG